jgi:hypothetical protein
MGHGSLRRPHRGKTVLLSEARGKRREAIGKGERIKVEDRKWKERT